MSIYLTRPVVWTGEREARAACRVPVEHRVQAERVVRLVREEHWGWEEHPAREEQRAREEQPRVEQPRVEQWARVEQPLADHPEPVGLPAPGVPGEPAPLGAAPQRNAVRTNFASCRHATR